MFSVHVLVRVRVNSWNAAPLGDLAMLRHAAALHKCPAKLVSLSALKILHTKWVFDSLD